MMASFDYNYQNTFHCNLCYADLSHTGVILHKRKKALNPTANVSMHSGSCSQMMSSYKCPVTYPIEFLPYSVASILNSL